MNRDFVINWLDKLKTYWFNKDVEQAASLFKNTTFYQETPFIEAYTRYEEILNEWEYIKNQNIKDIQFDILAIENNIVIVNWIFKRDDLEFNGIYEIKFNDKNECIYFKSWEMEK